MYKQIENCHWIRIYNGHDTEDIAPPNIIKPDKIWKLN